MIKEMDAQIEAMKLGLEYHFVATAIKITMLYIESEEKNKEFWDRAVLIEYFRLNVASFERYRTNPNIGDRLRKDVEDAFAPLDLSEVDEDSRTVLADFTRGEEVKLYHAYALKAAAKVYVDFKKKFNNVMIVDFIIGHFGMITKLIEKNTSITPN